MIVKLTSTFVLATSLLLTAAPALRAVDTAPNTKLDVPYKTTDKGELKLDLYYPDPKVSGPYPVVVYTHGGGWAAGSKQSAAKASMGKVVSSLAARGFCVAAVDYRLCRNGQATIRDCVTDCKDAIRYLAKNHDALTTSSGRRDSSQRRAAASSRQVSWPRANRRRTKRATACWRRFRGCGTCIRETWF